MFNIEKKVLGYKFYNPIKKEMLRSHDVIFFENEEYVDVNANHSVFPNIYTESSERNSVINENDETFFNENISEEESKTQDTHEI